MTPQTVAHRVPLSVRFLRQEYWCALPFPSPGDLLTQVSNMFVVLEGEFFTTEPSGKWKRGGYFGLSTYV